MKLICPMCEANLCGMRLTSKLTATPIFEKYQTSCTSDTSPTFKRSNIVNIDISIHIEKKRQDIWSTLIAPPHAHIPFTTKDGKKVRRHLAKGETR